MKKETVKKGIEYVIYALVLVGLYLLLSKIYAFLLISPDDNGYKKIMSGITTGEPSPYCWFIRYPLSYMLSSLYKITKGIAWYELFLMGCHLLCCFLVFCRANKIKGFKKLEYMFIAISVVLLLCGEYIINLEWSTTAAILGAVALFRYVTIPINLSPKKVFVEYLICLLLLVIGFMLRHSVICLFMPLAFLCWLKRSYDIKMVYAEQHDVKKHELLNLVFVLLAIVCVCAVLYVHKVAYSNEDWKAYGEYTKDRSIMVDYYGYPSYDEYEESYIQSGITREMYELMTKDYNYFLAFDNVQDVNLEVISDISRENNKDKTLGETIVYAYKHIKKMILDERFWIPGIVLMVCFMLLAMKLTEKNWVDNVFCMAIIMWFIVMLLYVAEDGRLPIRIGMAMLYGFCAVALGMLYQDTINEVAKQKKNGDKNAKHLLPGKVFLAFLIVGLVCINMLDIYMDNKYNEEQAIAKNQVIEYCAKHPDYLFLRDSAVLSQRGSLIFDSVESANYLSVGGWTYNSPVFEESLVVNEISNITDSVKNGKTVCYIATASRYKVLSERLNGYFESIDEPIGVYVMEVFDTIQGEVVVFKFTCKSTE